MDDIHRELRYEAYFLTVYYIVGFARSQQILFQGRSSAANSAVCYCLGVTEVDPSRSNMLFERFISKEHGEPPDIDVDFEHQRREEVIQYIYRKYGRDQAAIAAAMSTYRPRGALRETGKALGIVPQIVDKVAKSHQWFDNSQDPLRRLEESGLHPANPLIAMWANLAAQILNFPQHLPQHSGGFVISRGKLTRLVPVENAAMPDRSAIQWDKDDLAAERIETARAVMPFATVSDLARRAQLHCCELQVLAAANALRSFAGNSSRSAVAVCAAVPDRDMLAATRIDDETPTLAAPSEAQGS